MNNENNLEGTIAETIVVKSNTDENVVEDVSVKNSVDVSNDKPIDNYYNFVMFYDITNGNPNGDPDNGNKPRSDIETNKGIVTDVCIKRKIRNYVLSEKNNASPYRIFVKENTSLGDTIAESYDDEYVKSVVNDEKSTKKSKIGTKAPKAATEFMCKNFFDVRTFGAVLNIGEEGKRANCVKGPVQFEFGTSVDPITIQDNCITVCARSKETDSGKLQSMGRKYTIPYALYRQHGYISSKLAHISGFTQEDLCLFIDSLKNMFDEDISAARHIQLVKLFIFKHESNKSSVNPYKLNKMITVKKLVECPRSIDDYEIVFNKDEFESSDEMKDVSVSIY